jgi:hypothetical protein
MNRTFRENAGALLQGLVPVAACLVAGGLLAIWWAEGIKAWPVAVCSWAWGE